MIGHQPLSLQQEMDPGTTEPDEGTSTYDAGTVVDVVATPGAGYRFDEWTGDVGAIADVNAATTTITMNGDYSISVNFGSVYGNYTDITNHVLQPGWNQLSVTTDRRLS